LAIAAATSTRFLLFPLSIYAGKCMLERTFYQTCGRQSFLCSQTSTTFSANIVFPAGIP